MHVLVCGRTQGAGALSQQGLEGPGTQLSCFFDQPVITAAFEPAHCCHQLPFGPCPCHLVSRFTSL